MAGIHLKHHHHFIHESLMAWKHAFSCITGAVLFPLCMASQSWAQLSTDALQPSPKLTPLPHPEIARPAMLEPGVSAWIMVLAVIALLGLAILFVWLLFRKKIVTPPYSPPPLTYALERMEILRSRVDQIRPSDVAHQVSIILRDYQMGRYSLPAPYRTSEELYGVKSPVNREEIKQRFAPISSIYDRLEFASLPATKTDSLNLIEVAIQALQEEKRYQAPQFKITAPSTPMAMEPMAS